MSLETFQWLAERIGFPAAGIAFALGSVLAAWMKGWLITASAHEAWMREKDRQIAEEKERTLFWQDAFWQSSREARRAQDVTEIVAQLPPPPPRRRS